MSSFKSNSIPNSYLIGSAQPSFSRDAWNFGSLLAVCFGFPIVTGVNKGLWRNFSKQIRGFVVSRLYSTLPVKLDPNWVTGFIDAEGCFSISISKDNSKTTGWRVQTVFSINLHEKDIALLENIQKFFMGVGKIYSSREDTKQFRVASIKELQVIVNHFDKYLLITQKKADFILWMKAINLMSREKHLTIEGLQQIVNIKATINKGLSDELKKAFPNTIPVQRPLVLNQVIKGPSWLAGFVSGEGCFYIKMTKSKTHKLGEVVQLVFLITQHSRDRELMESLISYFGCGRYVTRNNKDFGEFIVTKCSYLTGKVIPLFNKHPILGVKSLDFADFCEAAELMKQGAHLTREGLEKIRLIKARMNKKRRI